MESLLDTIAGLPVHPLVVHVAVVLLPLAAVGLIACVLRTAWRERFGGLTVLVLLGGAGATLVAKESGEQLARRVGLPQEHAEWGERLAVAAAVLAVLAVLWWFFTRGGSTSGIGRILGWISALAALAVIAVAFAAGHSGATAVWAGRISGAASSASPSASPSTSTSSSPGATGYTAAQVAEHASSSSCWASVDGSVYDLTQWISQHPGGSERILALCGKDGTAAFNGQHAGNSEPKDALARFRLGGLTN